jgi:hypothetical protein
MLQLNVYCYTYVTLDGDIPIYLFDMGIQLALILNVATHARYVTIVV